MKDNIYTIGYTAFKINDFIDVLKKYNINCLIDVRSTPKSSYYTEYNKENLSKLLKEHNIVYRNYKNEFGARQDNCEFYTKEGYLNFEKFSSSKQFEEGVKKIKLAISMGFNVCIMCAEKNPWDCHRTIMVAHNIEKFNLEAKHILSTGETVSQKDIDNMLIEKYFPKKDQLSLFEEDNLLTHEMMLEQAYRLKNKEIGFRMEEEE